MSRETTSPDTRKRAVVSNIEAGLYYGLVLEEETLRARFDLIEVDGEGILLNRESGAVYRLNRTAYEVWAALVAGQSIVDIVARLMREFGIERGRAERDTLTALKGFPPAPPLVSSSDPFRWAWLPGGYGFFECDSLLWEVDARGDFLRWRAGSPPTVTQARLHLKTVVPKLLALRGIRVLHAATVEMKDSLVVFSGRSGAGKTTSARAFAATGARLVSEDLLILAPGDGARGAMNGEPSIRRWITEKGDRLAALPEGEVDCRELDRCLEGEQLPLKRILLLDAGRRAGDRIYVEELPRPEAMIALLESAFFASADASSWRSTFESLRGLVKNVSTARATMPEGLAALRAAVTDSGYSDMTAS